MCVIGLINMLDKKKLKSIAKSLEQLEQGLNQLRLNLDSAHTRDDKKLIKDISRSIITTELIIKRLKSEN